MKQLNDFLNEMMKVAEEISKIECPDNAVSYFKTQYNILEEKSELIGSDLDGLFDLSTKERYLVKKEINIKIEKINEVFKTNEAKYNESGYYDSSLQKEISKFNELFFLTRRFMQSLGSTQSKNYPYAFFKNEQNRSKPPVIKFPTEEESVNLLNDLSNDTTIPRKQIHLKKLDLKGLSEHLEPFFENPEEIYSVLKGNVPKEKLIFIGYSTELLYLFNKLKLNNRIVEERQDIIDWILKHFEFKDKKTGAISTQAPNIYYKKYRENVENIPKKYSELQKIEMHYKEE